MKVFVAGVASAGRWCRTTGRRWAVEVDGLARRARSAEVGAARRRRRHAQQPRLGRGGRSPGRVRRRPADHFQRNNRVRRRSSSDQPHAPARESRYHRSGRAVARRFPSMASLRARDSVGENIGPSMTRPNLPLAVETLLKPRRGSPSPIQLAPRGAAARRRRARRDVLGSQAGRRRRGLGDAAWGRDGLGATHPVLVAEEAEDLAGRPAPAAPPSVSAATAPTSRCASAPPRPIYEGAMASNLQAVYYRARRWRRARPRVHRGPRRQASRRL